MVTTYDSNTPGQGDNPQSEPIRENFQVLSNAAGLHVTEQETPNLTVQVGSGTYYISGANSLTFAGGDSPNVDVLLGGLPGQQRYALLTIDASGVLDWVYGNWVTPPTLLAQPLFPSDRLPLALVVVTFGMAAITPGLCVDARPLLNLGSGGGSGETGAQGPQGETGPQGPAGVTGLIGNTGLQGPTGVRGHTGPQGITGAGIQGATGLQGAAGNQGDTGVQGETGGGIQGATGLAGAQGDTGAGAQGDTGLAGAAGTQGATGVQGQTGAGIQGTTGVQGVQGTQGTTGVQGLQGDQGDTGVQGTTGVGGGNTLDAAYDEGGAGAGRTITVSDGPVTLNATADNVVLDINQTVASATSHVIDVINSGDGDVVRLQNDSTAATSQILHLVNSGNGSAIFVDNDVAEFALNIQQNAASTAISIDKTNVGTGNLLGLDNSGTGSCILVGQHGVGFAVSIDQNTNSTALNIDKTAVGTGNGIRVNNSGTGDGLEINQAGNGAAIMIDHDATSRPVIEFTPVVGNTRGDIAFSTARTADPSSPSEGDTWYNSTDGTMKVHDGTDNLPMAFPGVKGVFLASKVVDPPLQASPYGPVTETVTVTGAATGDVAIVTPDSALEEDVFWVVRGITAGVVTVELVDLKGVAVDVPAHTIHVMVFDLT